MIALVAWTALAGGLKGFDCGEPTYIAGTSGLDTASRNIRTFNRYYATAAIAERSLFPYVARPDWVDEDGFRTRAAVDFTYLADTAGLPALESKAGCGTVGVHPMDLAVNSIGLLGMTSSGFGVLFGGSATFAGPADNTAERWTTATSVMFPWTGFYSIGSPLLPLFPDAEDPWGTQADFLIGAVYDAGDFGTYRLAWTYQGGWLTNVSQEDVRLLVSAMLTPRLDGVPLFRAGFDRIRSKAGYTTVLGRKADIAALDDDEAATQHQGVILGQDDIFGVVDVGVEPAWEPQVRLAHARLGLHTRGFFAVPVTADPNEVDWVGTGDGDWHVGIEGGVVTLPALPWFGVEGGFAPYGVLVFRNNSAGPGVDGETEGREGAFGVFDLRFAYNDPEVLIYLPAAQGSFRAAIVANAQW